jgi:hypothetical protein
MNQEQVKKCYNTISTINTKTLDEVRPLVAFVSPPIMALDVISKGLEQKHSVTFGVINRVTSAIQHTKL